MSDQPVIVKKVSWADLCPWTIIFRTLPVAASITVLALALVGVLGASFTWWLSETIFIGSESPLRQDAAMINVISQNTSPYQGVFVDSSTDENAFTLLGAKISGPRAVFNQIKKPVSYIFATRIQSANQTGLGTRLGTTGFLYFLFGTACSLAIWSFIGLAITRVCLLRITRNETIGIDDAVDYACDHWLASLGGVSIPLLAVFALCVPTFLLGLLMAFDFGAAVVSLFWILVLVISTLMALLLLGLTFAWPLIVSSAGCEGQNAFDAMTRAYAYVFQRPLNCLAYSVIAMLFGGFCWLIVANLSHSVIELGYWSTSWGANAGSGEVPRIEILQGLSNPVAIEVTDIAEAAAAGDEETPAVVATPSPRRMLSFAQTTIGFWNDLIRTTAAAFLYGLFWCMASSVYLLLRKDVDDTEMDEIFIVDEKRTYELPPLKSDETGVPQVQTPTPVQDDDGERDSDAASDDEAGSNP